MSHLTQYQWERLIQLNPLREGETRTDWMVRLERIASDKTPTPEPSRLPYRQVGEDDE